MSNENAYEYLRRFILESVKLSPEEEMIFKQRLKANRHKVDAIRRKNKNSDSLLLGYDKEFQSYENNTTRENEIAELLCQGLSYQECAEFLKISYSTVKTHVNSLFQKECCNSLQQFIVKRLTGKSFQNGNNCEIKEDQITPPDIISDAYNLLNNLLG